MYIISTTNPQGVVWGALYRVQCISEHIVWGALYIEYILESINLIIDAKSVTQCLVLHS